MMAALDFRLDAGFCNASKQKTTQKSLSGRARIYFYDSLDWRIRKSLFGRVAARSDADDFAGEAIEFDDAVLGDFSGPQRLAIAVP
jgi:hypothetical protein